MLLVLLGGGASAAAQDAPANGEPAAPIGVAVEDGRLSVSLADAPLADVLDTIARQYGMTMRIANRAARATLTDSFADLPIEDGLRRLLEGMNYSLVQAGDGSRRRIVLLTVTSSQAGAAARGPEDRGRAIDALAEQPAGEDGAWIRKAIQEDWRWSGMFVPPRPRADGDEGLTRAQRKALDRLPGGEAVAEGFARSAAEARFRLEQGLAPEHAH